MSFIRRGLADFSYREVFAFFALLVQPAKPPMTAPYAVLMYGFEVIGHEPFTQPMKW